MRRMRLVVVAVLCLGGCVGRNIREEIPEVKSTEGPPLKLRALGIRRAAVVEALDRTDQGAGMPVARALRVALAEAGAPVLDLVVDRPGPILARSWLAARAKVLAVDGFITGTVSGYSIQPDQRRAYVSVTAAVLDVGGAILWSRRVRGIAPLQIDLAPMQAKEGGMGNNSEALQDPLQIAASIAAKEFANDFAKSP